MCCTFTLCAPWLKCYVHSYTLGIAIHTACGRPFSFAYFLILCERTTTTCGWRIQLCAYLRRIWFWYFAFCCTYSAQSVPNHRNYIELNWTKKTNTIDTRPVPVVVCVLRMLVCVCTKLSYWVNKLSVRSSITYPYTHRHTCVCERTLSQQTHTASEWASQPYDRLCVAVRGSFMLYVFVPKSRKDLFSWKSNEPQNRRALIEVLRVFVVWSPQLFAHSLHSVRIGYFSLLTIAVEIVVECMCHCYLVFMNLEFWK